MTTMLSRHDVILTAHARERANRRRFGVAQITAVIDWGRLVYTRGALVFVIGRKEVGVAALQGIDLRELEGFHVVCGTEDGVVLTVYRNHDLRALRPALGRGRHRPREARRALAA